jgi:hypothetical protein
MECTPTQPRPSRLQAHSASELLTRRAGTRTTLRPRFFVSVLLLAASTSACNVYAGSAKTLKPQELTEEPGWIAVKGVPDLRQVDEHDCGPTALTMVLSFWQPERRGQTLGLPLDRQITVGEMRDVAREHGFSSFVVEGKPEDLVFELEHGRPVIVGVAKQTLKNAVTHYEVVVGMNKQSQRVATLDPAAGYRQNSFSGFLTEWQATGRVLLVVVPKKAMQPAAAAAVE